MTYTVSFQRVSGATETFTYAVSAAYGIQGMSAYTATELSTSPSVYTFCPAIEPVIPIDYCAILNEFGVTCPVTDDQQAICMTVWNNEGVNMDENERKFSITTAGVGAGSTWWYFACDATSCLNTGLFTESWTNWFKFAVAPSTECSNIHTLASLDVVTEPASRFITRVETDCTNYAAAKTPFASLPATVAKEFSMTHEGVIIDPIEEDNWVVPYKFYSLTKIRVYKSDAAMSGFEVVYEAPDSFTGYEPISHLFGTR